MHSIVRESLTELISQNVPDSTGIASVMKYILKPQTNFNYLNFYYKNKQIHYYYLLLYLFQQI